MEEAAAQTARQLMRKTDCSGQVAQLMTALSLGDELLGPDERIQGHVLLQRCAKASKSWRALRYASGYLLTHAPAKASAEDLIRALLSLGDERGAAVAFGEIARALPEQRSNLAIARSLIACHHSDAQRCFTASGQSLGALARDHSASRQAVLENLAFHAFSAGALGRYDIYDTEMKQVDAALSASKADPRMLDTFKLAIEQARSNKLFVDEDHASELAIGTYHLLSGGKIRNTLDNADALVTLRMINQDRRLRSVTVTVEIPGITDAAIQTIALPPGKQVNQRISPPFKIGFDVAKLRAARASQIALHIVDTRTHAAVLDKTLPIEILPRDHLPLRRKVGADDTRTTWSYAAAWVMPNAPEIDAFLAKAKARLPEGAKFSGFFSPTLPQVKALFEELRSRGMSYVLDPALFEERGSVQRTRLPAEVLASTNAQCLEGTLLYASLLESIGIEPVLVFVPGHAFLAWKPSKADRTTEPRFYLETTMTGGTHTFEEAMQSATNTYRKNAAARHFERGDAGLIDIAALRKAGYLPQPY